MAEQIIPPSNPERMKVALQATWQAEQILLALRNAAASDADGLQYLVDGLVPRLSRLNTVVMLSIDGEGETTESLREMLTA